MICYFRLGLGCFCYVDKELSKTDHKVSLCYYLSTILVLLYCYSDEVCFCYDYVYFVDSLDFSLFAGLDLALLFHQFVLARLFFSDEQCL